MIKSKIQVLSKSKRKKKKILIEKYMSVLSNIRDQILMNYYHDLKRNFKADLSNYVALKSKGNFDSETKSPPAFRYIPSEDTLKGLISAALSQCETKQKS